MKNIAETYVKKWLEKADITVNGSRPWDLRINNSRIYTRLLLSGSLGAGESYMDGDWDCDALDEMVCRLFRVGFLSDVFPQGLPAIWLDIRAFFSNMGKPSRAFQVGKKHYDIGNDLYERMLDKHLIYSCGYWKNADNLGKAQEDKLDLICRKLQLKPGMRVLDIGGGWGGLSRYAAEKYHVEMVSISVSKEQVAFANAHKKDLPIENLFQDYRSTTGIYDRIVSVGMFEHVGSKNYAEYMKFASTHLKDEGLFLLHTIGATKKRFINDVWIERYIFPNSLLPSIGQIEQAAEQYFVMEDWHNFGVDYDTTLMAWYHNFEQAWPELASKYGERFYRMWRFYLLTCAGSFRSRFNQLWQVVFSKKPGLLGGYTSIR